ncbi:hypothetical protein [Spelaeicoccus albus]|uniref:HD domain-containing protein n=1 Tax=Spelaeicoccus albus TaxID=1280376 RepID=A0A7Z0A7Y3_9MICO|nr:hypothetical protein [Spelaeicoccus albus]NYI66094.1 hypothetical protein [Spelaeicoccus albus]
MTATTATQSTNNLYLDLVEVRSKNRTVDNHSFGNDFFDFANEARIAEALDAEAAVRFAALVHDVVPGENSPVFHLDHTWERPTEEYEAALVHVDQLAKFPTRNEDEVRILEQRVQRTRRESAGAFMNLFIEPFANHLRYSGLDLGSVFVQLREQVDHTPAA